MKKKILELIENENTEQNIWDTYIEVNLTRKKIQLYLPTLKKTLSGGSGGTSL